MVQLNLPAFEYALKQVDGKVWIFDMIRKRHVVLTPEEWVRQHVIHYFVTHKNYPKALMQIERGLKYNQLGKRFDLLVTDRNGNPWMIVECKAPSQKVDQKALEQASVYNSNFKAPYLFVTNGIDHFCFSTDWINKRIERLKELPAYS